MHFLDRTDPTFKDDLKRSEVHVTEVVRRINECLSQKTHQCISKIELRVMETKCRPCASKRKKYSDNGDVMVVWVQNGIEKHAMLEFKQRAGYKFKTLADLKFRTVWVDSLAKFEKIRKRNDTLGYVLTDKFMTCIFSICMNVFEEHMQVEEFYFRDRPTKRCLIPKEFFHEGMDNVCEMIMNLAATFEERDQEAIEYKKKHRQIRIMTKKIKDLEFQLENLKKQKQKLQNHMNIPIQKINKRRQTHTPNREIKLFKRRTCS